MTRSRRSSSRASIAALVAVLGQRRRSPATQVREARLGDRQHRGEGHERHKGQQPDDLGVRHADV